MKQKTYNGDCSLERLPEILKNEGTEKIFLVTGENSFKLSGAKERLDKFLTNNYLIERFSKFSSNPKFEDIEKGFLKFKRKKYNIIIAIGGGSVIDVAKTIKLLYFNEFGIRVPLVAIPTTSGSGSESTHFIVYYVNKEKQSKGIPEITLPNYVILDPSLIMSLPKSIMASSGMDALGQAIESYWSINSNNESKKLAEEAIKLLVENLENAINIRDKKYIQKVMWAANLSGKAINITKTTACHAIAYPITSYFGIPHGHAVGLTLGEMLKFNYQVNKKNCNDERGVKYIKNTIQELCSFIGKDSIQGAKSHLTKIMRRIGLKTELSIFGINKLGIEIILRNGFALERVKNNPRILTKENLRTMLNNILN